MKPFVSSKIFGGKKYRYLTYEDTKTDARKRAKLRRLAGHKVRVTREKSPLGKIFYALWTRG